MGITKIKSIIVILVWALSLLAPKAVFASEYQLKAALLYNFIEFVEWPRSVSSRKITMCVIGGDDLVLPVLREIVQSKNKKGVTALAKEKDSLIDECHIVYIGSTQQRSAMSLLIGRSQKLPILTVSDYKGFASLGGMISMYFEGGEVKLKANIKALRKAKLTVDSELLEIMEIVK